MQLSFWTTTDPVCGGIGLGSDVLIPRIIPCLLIHDGAMVKTRRFRERIYVGDPVNVINLFNQFEVDEIMLLDIGASITGRQPDLGLIRELAEECWVPLAYGGGVSNSVQFESIICAGVEKIVIGSAIAHNLELVSQVSREFGRQAVVGSIDAKKKWFGGYDTYAKSASRRLGIDPCDRARELEEAGAGEILIQAIDQDGEMKGYDLALIRQVTSVTNLPVVACGGAGRLEDLAMPIRQAGASAAAAGSLFVFSGLERGVLINFPERSDLENILKSRESIVTSQEWMLPRRKLPR